MRPFGEAAVVVEYGERIDPDVHRRVLGADRALAAAAPPWLEEAVPTYRSLLVRFDPLAATPQQVAAALEGLVEVDHEGDGRRIEIAWTPAHGDDLDHVADHAGCAPDDVVDALEDCELRVYLVGFAPGFTYLGGVPERLHVARRSTPRPPVTPGAVLLAGGQAALCPVAMPTGWWVVGHTDELLFDAADDPPSRLAAGDRVRLVRR